MSYFEDKEQYSSPLPKLRSLFDSNYKTEATGEVSTITESSSIFKQAYKKRRIGLEDELDLYLKTPQEVDSIDPISWWKDHEGIYPSLSKLAYHILCISATSVPSEQSFSKSGDLITKKRNRLGHNTIRASMCLSSWLNYFKE